MNEFSQNYISIEVMKVCYKSHLYVYVIKITKYYQLPTTYISAFIIYFTESLSYIVAVSIWILLVWLTGCLPGDIYFIAHQAPTFLSKFTALHLIL